MGKPRPICALVCLLLFLCGQIILMITKVEATSNVHIVYLGGKQHDDPMLKTDSHHDMLASVVGSKEIAAELMVYSYKHGFSGFAAKLSESQAQKVAELPGVVRVIPNSLHRLQTTRSWDFLGLSANSPVNTLHNSSMGDGVIIGVLDTGIWPEAKAFSDKGLGPIPSHWKGVCESGKRFKAKSHCNKKIIGARWFVEGFLAEYGQPLNTSGNREFFSPRDASGHGTHTASTAAGTFIDNVSYKGLALGTIRGGAPRARLAIYKVCWNVLGGQCSSADILKAFDEAIHDGVDVLSLSIGSSIPLFSDIDERDGIATGSFHAVAKGITVVCGAANDGPFAQTVQNTAPWILTVAASSMDRAFPTPITLGNNKTFLGQAIYSGKEIGFRSLIYPEAKGLDPNSAGVCQFLSVDNSMVAGKVVLCFTSMNPGAVRSASEVVKEAGGVGLIVAKNPSEALYPCTDGFPCVEVDYEIGTRILFYIRSTRSPVVKLSPSKTIVGKPVLAKVAHFSSRGPNSIAPAILKPDIAAPGVNILAATSPLDRFQDGGYVMHSGTSMATPHVSGIAALLKAIHPDWSPAAIKSAIVTTAWINNPSGFPTFAEGSPQKLADPFDYGGGIANPNGAADPGLVYDMGTDDYVNYLCAMDYNNTAISRLTGKPTVCPTEGPSILNINLPSITIPNLRNSVILTRTVTNVGASDSIYRAVIEVPFCCSVSVEPHVLVFNHTTRKITFSVTVSTTYEVNTGYFFGSITWIDGVHTVRSPLSVRTEISQPYIVDK
ncbi:subtilisin-like protease SBT3.6 isoform X1 [Populus alba x Populus x berolinensis]|nr:subtilisin-like protease SBT3.6 isoform X1 [Populus alba x Populus x berolinensis]